jgi:hypothetical protein
MCRAGSERPRETKTACWGSRFQKTSRLKTATKNTSASGVVCANTWKRTSKRPKKREPISAVPSPVSPNCPKAYPIPDGICSKSMKQSNSSRQQKPFLTSQTKERTIPLAARVLGVKRTIRVSREEAEALIIDATEHRQHRGRVLIPHPTQAAS